MQHVRKMHIDEPFSSGLKAVGIWPQDVLLTAHMDYKRLLNKRCQEKRKGNDMLNNFQALKEFERSIDRRLGVLGHSLPQEYIHLGTCIHKLTYPTQTEHHWE